MRILLLVVALVLCGCKTTTFEDRLHGIKVTDRRFIMSTSADVTFEAATNGTFRVYVKTRSGTDVEAIEAAARGTAQGLKP